MRRLLRTGLASASLAGAIVPVAAPAQVADQVVTVYGDERCPSSNGQDIVVCRRLPATEKFRIPRDLRESEAAPQALGGTAVSAMRTTGGTGTQVQSCNAIGAGVNAGCVKAYADQWRAEKNAQKREGQSIP